ncbi:HEAT repeat domain-containing protein [Tundrisphaera lichenicola]|uniref:HEAT repeat domain-containing protein n=1 Tax=Tundrisphaera lichenicola TaxID=2029860 RepID=UPI003EBFD8D5
MWPIALTAAGVCLLALFATASRSQFPGGFATSKGTDDLGFAVPQTPSQPAPINRPDVLDLEPAVAQAELILAVRLVDVTETKIVHGGQNVQVTQQYRFEPVRVLKGIFARGELLMTGQDLGIYRFAEGSDRLSRGQLMLVLLARQGQNYFNCNGATTLGQSIPRLDGKDDPLLASAEVLIEMTRRRDRGERVSLLVDGLKRAKGRDATPLLLALRRRALLASRDPGIAEAILPHLKAASPTLREVAARSLSSLLDSLPGPKPLDDPSENRPFPTEAARALIASLGDSTSDVAARVAVIDALGATDLAAIRKSPEALAWLDAEPTPSTFAEEAARLRALGKLGATDRKDEAARAYESLRLDAPAEIQEAAGRTIARLDPMKAVGLISSRLERKEKAGFETSPEIARLGDLPPEVAAPALLKAGGRPLGSQEQLAFAQACAKVADPRLIPAIATLLDPRQWQVRASAIEALVKINTDEAASALWPHLIEEPDLSRQLRLVAFLGRHGFRDGYAQAIEHLSQAALLEEAVGAVAAIGEPSTIPELRRIWETSNDLTWNAAAIRGLARLGQADIAPRLLEIARTPGDPLADSALIGLGDLGTPEALPIVREALSSRRDEIVIAAARAAARLLGRPSREDGPTRDRLAGLLADADASAPVRQAALGALSSLGDPRLTSTLDEVARDASLEGTPLLEQVERAIRERGSKPADPGKG